MQKGFSVQGSEVYNDFIRLKESLVSEGKGSLVVSEEGNFKLL